MRTRTPIVVAAALLGLSALLLLLVTQTGLVDRLAAWLGSRTAVAIAIVLLVALAGVALAASIYGVRQDDTRRTPGHGRRTRR